MTTNRRNGSAAGGDAERDLRLDRLYREIPREEPPARLDAAILAAAHREVGARPRPLSARLLAWRVPVSVAAVVMLSVSLVTLVRKEGGDKLDISTGPYSMDSKTAPVPREAREVAKTPGRAQPEQPAPDAIGAQERAKPAPPTGREDIASSNTATTETAEEAARRSAAASARLSEEAVRGSSSGSVAGLSSAAPEARVPVPPPAAPAPRPFQDAPAASEQRPAPSTDGAATGATVARPPAGMRDRSGETESAVAPAESKAAAEPTGPMAGNTAGSASADRSPAVSAAPKPEAARRPESRMMAKRAQAGPSRIAPLVKELDSQPAEKWLEKIEALRREQRRGEADDLLTEFKRRFPDYPLPPALR